MTLREIIWLLDTDAFYIHKGERNNLNAEYIETSAKGSYKGLKKYFDCEVVSITPEQGAMSIVVE